MHWRNDIVRYGRQEAVEQMLALDGVRFRAANAIPFGPYLGECDERSGLIDCKPLR
jgi:hypothetical protein